LGEKRSRCLDCELECRFKGKNSYRKIEDLDKVPEGCGYRKEVQLTWEELSRSIRQSRQAIEAIAEASRRYQQETKTVAEWWSNLSKVGRAALLPIIESYSGLQPYLESLRNATKLVATSTPMYFPSKDLLVLEAPIKVPKKSVARKFTERLNACPKGKAGWLEFQDLCKEILVHLFVPPLVRPFEKSRTVSGLHIRDLIFDIPYSAGRFWGYIRDKFDSLALVVECKNYSSRIKGNQIVISSKYLGKNRLGRFSIVFSRLGPAESATKEMKRLWTEDDKLVLCLMDDHLIKMLELKERKKKPEIVIDKAMHEFFRVLE